MRRIRIEIPKEAKQIMDSRHIMRREVRQVISYAEKTGQKLYQPGQSRYLAKKKIGKATFYVEYSATAESQYVVHTAYFHKAEIVEAP